MDNDTNKSQVSLLGQGLTIIGSILLAFAIDATWDNWVESGDTEELLLSFSHELDYNIRLGEESQRFFAAQNESTLKILELASLDDSNEVDASEFDRLLIDLTWWQDSHFSTGALDSIIQGGLLQEVEPLELRVSLAGWTKELEFVSRVERQDYDTYQNYLLPFLQQHASLQQISNAMAERPGGNSEGWQNCKVPNSSLRDHRELLADSEFLGLVTNTLWNGKDAVHFTKVFLERAADLESQLEMGGHSESNE